MKLHQLKVFDAVARHRSVTNAASELSMSQPAVSLQLKLLEQEYDRKFLKRGTRGVELTEYGQRLLDAARPILVQVEALKQNFRKGRRRNVVRPLLIAGSNTLSVTILPDVIIAFENAYPQTEIELTTKSSYVIEREVAQAQVDIGLITTHTELAGCVYEPYKEHEAVAFVPPGHPLCGATINLAELCTYPIVARKDSTGILAIKKQGYDVNLILQCDAPDAVKASVKKGIGVGILFRARVGLEISTGELCQINVPKLRSIRARSFIIYRKNAVLSSHALHFLDMLRAMKDDLP